MRIAYADPPYMRKRRRGYYGDQHPDAGTFDRIDGHVALVDRLVNDFPDGWALSTTSPMLRELLPACPDDVRVMAWTKTYTAFLPSVRIAYAWEPVLVRGGRRRTTDQPTILDWIQAPSPAASGNGFVGAKPPAFAEWLFDVLGLVATDDFFDLFPGSGAVGEAWYRYRDQLPLWPPTEGEDVLFGPRP